MNKLLYLFSVVLICWGCADNSGTEKHQNKRDNIVNVRDKVKEIEIENVLIGINSDLAVIGNYLVIADAGSYDKIVHLFDKNTFSYITSTGDRGEGPNEITHTGYVGVDETYIYLPDFGKLQVVGFNLDSVLVNPLYTPEVKMKMNSSRFISEFLHIDDTRCIGTIIIPIGTSDFTPSLAKWNMNTGEVKPISCEHPDIEKIRATFAVSAKNNIYVACYHYHDLMSICTLNGELKYNIYGRSWDTKKSNKKSYYGSVLFCGDKIFATYSGEDTFCYDKNGEVKGNYPTKFQVFDINGDYLQTLETGYNINCICYDEENNRILMSLNDEIQFAYLDLDGIVK